MAIGEKRLVSIDCSGLVGSMGDGYVHGEESGSLLIRIYSERIDSKGNKETVNLKKYKLNIDLENETAELEQDPIPPVVQEFVQACKRAYNTDDLKTAWEFWCAIYDRLEGAENTGTLFKVMRQFTDQQVYDITDWGKAHTEI